MWLIFTHWLLLAWAIICCPFQSRQSRQSLYLHGNWNYQEYCVSTSIGKLNILETCIFFFSHLNKLSRSNTWPGTASSQYNSSYLKKKMYKQTCPGFELSFSSPSPRAITIMLQVPPCHQVEKILIHVTFFNTNLHYQSKLFGHPQKFLFLILKVSFFLLEQVKQ